MPTSSEVRAQLSGPGGMFEVTTDTVLGREIEVYKERMPSLRSVAEVGLMRGDDVTFIVYGDRTYTYGEFMRTANGVSHALRDRFDIAKGDRVAEIGRAHDLQSLMRISDRVFYYKKKKQNKIL